MFRCTLQDAVKVLLAHGCNVKAGAVDDMNALHFAAQKGHTEVLRQLLNAGKSACKSPNLLLTVELGIAICNWCCLQLLGSI
jgi:ankyrin repeat protein